MGAGRPEAAIGTLYAVLALSITEFLVASFVIVSCSRVLGYAFSEEKEVVHYVKEMAPFLGMSIILDGIQAVLSGTSTHLIDVVTHTNPSIQTECKHVQGW